MGVGRDVKDARQQYNSMHPIAIYTIDHKTPVAKQIEERYTAGLQRLAGTRNRSVMSKEDMSITNQLGGLGGECTRLLFPFLQNRESYVKDPFINEQLLCHGTAPGSVSKIFGTGFLSSEGGLFGPGVYLADTPGKTDQYTTAVPLSNLYGNVDAMRRELLAKDLQHFGGISHYADPGALDHDICTCVISRTALGRIAYADLCTFKSKTTICGKPILPIGNMFDSIMITRGGFEKHISESKLSRVKLHECNGRSSVAANCKFRFREYIIPPSCANSVCRTRVDACAPIGLVFYVRRQGLVQTKG